MTIRSATKPLALAAFTAFAIGGSAHAMTTITFEEQGPQPMLFGDQVALTDQYAAEGVTFSGGWEVLDDSSNFGVDALSGDNFAAFNSNIEGSTQTLGLSFATGISQIAGFLSGGSEAANFSIAGFFDGVLASSVTVASAVGSYSGFTLDGLFNSVTISSLDDTSGVLDDLSFTNVDDLETVPLPAGGLLLLTTLGGFAALRRRRNV